MNKLFNVKVINKKNDSVEIIAEKVSENKADKIEMGLLRQIDFENYEIEVEEIKI